MQPWRLPVLFLALIASGAAWSVPDYLTVPPLAMHQDASSGAGSLPKSVTSLPSQVSAGTEPRFELVFPEVVEGTGSGFADPVQGAQRREIARQVFERVSQLLQGAPGWARIRLDSRSPWLDAQTLAVGLPYFRCVDGFQKPIIHDALLADEHVHEVEGELFVNFGIPISASLDTPPRGQYDLYTLLYHEAMHVLGFVGFTVEADGRAPDCGGARMLPAIAAFATNERGQRLWIEQDGEIVFAGNQAELPEDGRPVPLGAVLAGPGPLRLVGSRLRVSGHWLPEDFPGRTGVLMLKEPFPSGQLRRNLTPETKTVLNVVLGFEVSQAVRGLTGSWIDAAQPGQGFTLHFISENRFAIYFFGFTDSGERLWLVGLHSGDFTLGDALTIPLFEATGGRFSAGDAHTPTELPWGELQLRFADCQAAEARLVGMDGSKTMQLLPLARVDTLDCY